MQKSMLCRVIEVQLYTVVMRVKQKYVRVSYKFYRAEAQKYTDAVDESTEPFVFVYNR